MQGVYCRAWAAVWPQELHETSSLCAQYCLLLVMQAIMPEIAAAHHLPWLTSVPILADRVSTEGLALCTQIHLLQHHPGTTASSGVLSI